MSSQVTGLLHMIDGTVNADRYIEILQDKLVPSTPNLRTADGDFIFQQDEATCHTAKKVKTWMTQNNIPLLPWPTSSPDMSPIETLWGVMKKELRKNPAKTVNELKTKIQGI